MAPTSTANPTLTMRPRGSSRCAVIGRAAPPLMRAPGARRRVRAVGLAGIKRGLHLPAHRTEVGVGADLPFEAAAEVFGGVFQLAQRLSGLAGQFGQAAGTEDDKGDNGDGENLSGTDAEHAPMLGRIGLSGLVDPVATVERG